VGNGGIRTVKHEFLRFAKGFLKRFFMERFSLTSSMILSLNLTSFLTLKLQALIRIL
jgi:hypothetical protein